jgi:competence protein ComEC
VVELVVTTRSDARPSRSAEAWGGDQVQSRARVLPGPALLGRERVHLPGSPEVLVTGSAGSGLAQVRSGQEVRVRARVSTSGALRVMRVTEVEVVDPGPAWRRTLQDTARERTSELPADPVALARGMTTGDTIGLGEETEEAMRRAGISHLVAVSGRPIRLVVLAPNVTRSTRLPW